MGMPRCYVGQTTTVKLGLRRKGGEERPREPGQAREGGRGTWDIGHRREGSCTQVVPDAGSHRMSSPHVEVPGASDLSSSASPSGWLERAQA